MSDSLNDRGQLIYREMLAHLPLFAHRNPQTVAVFDDRQNGVLEEILKHTSVTTIWQPDAVGADARIRSLQTAQPAVDSLDIVIVGHHNNDPHLKPCLETLRTEGILLQLCESLFDINHLKTIQQQLRDQGFSDILPLHFAQPQFASGWRSAVIATKQGTIKRPREKDIFNKTFTTQYYNLDMHRAAFALPEFMREAGVI